MIQIAAEETGSDLSKHMQQMQDTSTIEHVICFVAEGLRCLDENIAVKCMCLVISVVLSIVVAILAISKNRTGKNVTSSRMDCTAERELGVDSTVNPLAKVPPDLIVMISMYLDYYDMTQSYIFITKRIYLTCFGNKNNSIIHVNYNCSCKCGKMVQFTRFNNLILMVIRKQWTDRQFFTKVDELKNKCIELKGSQLRRISSGLDYYKRNKFAIFYTFRDYQFTRKCMIKNAHKLGKIVNKIEQMINKTDQVYYSNQPSPYMVAYLRQCLLDYDKDIPIKRSHFIDCIDSELHASYLFWKNIVSKWNKCKSLILKHTPSNDDGNDDDDSINMSKILTFIDTIIYFASILKTSKTKKESKYNDKKHVNSNSNCNKFDQKMLCLFINILLRFLLDYKCGPLLRCILLILDDNQLLIPSPVENKYIFYQSILNLNRQRFNCPGTVYVKYIFANDYLWFAAVGGNCVSKYVDASLSLDALAGMLVIHQVKIGYHLIDEL